uniref:Uncharacterized protein n=1 Tax=Aegilops tauschii subsp. strangulata TaxID=200361 RepID=A0A453FP62_AEGTS
RRSGSRLARPLLPPPHTTRIRNSQPRSRPCSTRPLLVVVHCTATPGPAPGGRRPGAGERRRGWTPRSAATSSVSFFLSCLRSESCSWFTLFLVRFSSRGQEVTVSSSNPGRHLRASGRRLIFPPQIRVFSSGSRFVEATRGGGIDSREKIYSLLFPLSWQSSSTKTAVSFLKNVGRRAAKSVD